MSVLASVLVLVSVSMSVSGVSVPFTCSKLVSNLMVENAFAVPQRGRMFVTQTAGDLQVHTRWVGNRAPSGLYIYPTDIY